MIKVILCLHHFLPEFIGGTEIYALRLAQNLITTGIEPVILVPNFNKFISEEYEFEQLRIIKYGENSYEDRKMILGKTEPEGMNEFESILVREMPSVVHFHELAPGRGINVLHVQKARDLNIPVVLTFHLSYYTCLKGTLIYKDKKKCDGIIKIKKCTECIYHSRGIKGIKATLLQSVAYSLFDLGIDSTNLNTQIGTALGFPYVVAKLKNDLEKLSVICEKIIVLADWYKNILERNGIPPTKLLYMKQGLSGKFERNILNHKITFPLKVVYVGRISELKGVHLLIDAVIKLPKNKISLVIYGSEGERVYADKCKSLSSLNANIVWKGTIPSEDVIAAISQYHLLCLPSFFEMSPTVIQEAFAAGLPVLASDIYGNAEQINDGVNGWLFNIKDVDDLTNKLKYLISDLNVLLNAKNNLPQVESFVNVANKHHKLYADILKSKN